MAYPRSMADAATILGLDADAATVCEGDWSWNTPVATLSLSYYPDDAPEDAFRMFVAKTHGVPFDLQWFNITEAEDLERARVIASWALQACKRS